MDERSFKTKLTKALKKKGFFCYSTHETYRAGVPDVYACFKGLSIWLELKYTESDGSLPHPLTAQQSIFLRDINNAGGLGLVLVGREEGMCHYERITEAGERKTLEWDLCTLDEAIEWISSSATDFATPSTDSTTDSSKSTEGLFDFL